MAISNGCGAVCPLSLAEWDKHYLYVTQDLDGQVYLHNAFPKLVNEKWDGAEKSVYCKTAEIASSHLECNFWTFENRISASIDEGTTYTKMFVGDASLESDIIRYLGQQILTELPIEKIKDLFDVTKEPLGNKTLYSVSLTI